MGSVGRPRSAQKIARNLGLYETIEESDDLYPSLMEEWKKATP
jgi:hypothetical protein